MINSQRLLLALFLGTASSALAQSHTAGSFEDGGDTQVSAMMVRLLQFIPLLRMVFIPRGTTSCNADVLG